jgi:hypothetical protein
MKIINRGYISVTPLKPFHEWVGTFEDEDDMGQDELQEPNIYLITEDFFDVEPIIEQHFKKIFANELSMITENEEDWPQDRNMEVFLQWFQLDFGTTVFDVEKSDIKAERV